MVYLVTSDAAGIVEVEYFLKNLLDLIGLPFNRFAIIQSRTFTSEFRLVPKIIRISPLIINVARFARNDIFRANFSPLKCTIASFECNEEANG